MASRDLTRDPVGRLLVSLSLPILITTSLQSVYALAGLVWVGRLGEAAVGGLSIGLQVFFVVLAVAQVLATTAMADLSQAFGAGRRDLAASTFSGYLVLAAILGAVASVAAWFVSEPYVAAFTDDPGVYEQGVAYFRAAAPTFLTQVVQLVLVQGMRAVGDFTTPVRVGVVTVLLNLVLDPLLMYGLGPFPELGIAGVGVATTICQALAITWLLVGLVLPGRAFRLARPVIGGDLLRGLLFRGLPAGLQFLLLSVAMGLMLYAMKPFGAAWTASAGGGFRLVQQAILPIVAASTAAAAIAGQNEGAGRRDRVRGAVRAALLATVAWSLVGIGVAELGAPWLALIFASGEELGPAVAYLHRASPAVLGFAISLPSTFVLQALKRPVLPLVAAIARIVFLGAVALSAGPDGIGPQTVFLAFAAGAWLEGGLDLVLVWRALADPVEERAAVSETG